MILVKAKRMVEAGADGDLLPRVICSKLPGSQPDSCCLIASRSKRGEESPGSAEQGAR